MWENWVRLVDIYVGRLSGLKYKLVCCFELVPDMFREFVNDMDGLAFLKRELVGFGVDRHHRVHNCTSRLVSIHMFQDYLTRFFQ